MKHEAPRLRPTRLWLVFGPILVCMMLAAINYANNLVYAVLYLVGSLCFISIFHTRRNLSALTVEHVRIKPAFAGENIEVEIFLRGSTAGQPVFGLQFARLDKETGPKPRPIAMELREGKGFRVRGGDSCSAVAIFPATRRGMYHFSSLVIKSSYPFGLFSSSFQVPVDTVYFIYPKPKGREAWPELRSSGDNGSPYSTRPGDDFSGVRVYQPGESLRHVDWKAYARGRPLSVKQFTGGDGQELWLDAGEMSRLPLEDRLSQLSLWIVNAEKVEIPYALKLGRTTLPLGLGPGHSRQALEILATAGMGVGE